MLLHSSLPWTEVSEVTPSHLSINNSIKPPLGPRHMSQARFHAVCVFELHNPSVLIVHSSPHSKSFHFANTQEFGPSTQVTRGPTIDNGPPTVFAVGNRPAQLWTYIMKNAPDLRDACLPEASNMRVKCHRIVRLVYSKRLCVFALPSQMHD